MAALGTMSVQSFAEYEQLIGGVETLFKESEDTVSGYADNAYKTAGLSANAYMETVTSFAASLLQSLEGDTEEAANAANQAVVDMSDNANKMGSTMESIQNAYQGFAKQNYTMLDNLKLGYGGTKEEMQRLLEDATALSGVEYDIANLNDVYSAIHVIQTELGITGTTAKEASSTISGSLSAMKASWTNLLSGLADENADLDALIDNFVDSVVTVGENITPRVEAVIEGIGELIEKMLPIIADKIPSIINNILPDLMQSGVDMVISLIEGIQESFPEIMSAGGEILTTLVSGIVEILPTLGLVAYDIIAGLLTGITQKSGEVLNSGSETLLEFINGIADKVPELLQMIVDTVIELAMAITEPDTLSNIIDAGIELIRALIVGLIDALPELIDAVPEIVANIVASLIKSAPMLLEAAVEILGKLAKFLIENVPKLVNSVPILFGHLVDAFREMDWRSIGSNIIDGIWNGLKAGWNWLIDSVKSLANGLFGAAQDELEIHSPSRKFKWLGEMCVAGMDEPLEEYNPYDTIEKSMQSNIIPLKASYAGAYANGSYGASDFSANISSNVNVVLEGDAKQVFRLVRMEKDDIVRRTGDNPLI